MKRHTKKVKVDDKLIGVFPLGSFNVRLYWMESSGGDFTFRTDKVSTPEIRIGFDYDEWYDLLRVILHELLEFEIAHMGLRYSQSVDWGCDQSGYIFLFNHPQLSEVCGRIAFFMAQAIPEIQKKWKAYRKSL